MSQPLPADAGWEFWIDVGGTFTDCIARTPAGELRTHKLLSSGEIHGVAAAGSSPDTLRDPARIADPNGFYEGWTLVQRESQVSARVASFDSAAGVLRLDSPIAALRPGAAYVLRCGLEAPVIGVRWLLGRALRKSVGAVELRLGTTRGTNALLERRGARTALATTAGFGDILRIGTQARPRLFDLHIRKPAPLYERVIKISERVAADGAILRPLDPHDTLERLREARDSGIESLAICLLNSYRNPAHESRLHELAQQAGFEHVSVSSRLSPIQRIVPRAETTVVDAYLAPVIRAYVAGIRAALPAARIRLMSSSGAVASADLFAARDSVLSGPAGGAIGAAAVARRAGLAAAIALDMGGTSTDVSRVATPPERRYEMLIEDRETGGGVRVCAPMLAIETVAAGGGSICGFDGIKPIVGPRSAGASPGPACYGAGGPLCVTDANALLGRIATDEFPFPLDLDAARRRIDEQIERIAAATERRYSREELASGYVDIANEHMAGAIRRVSVQRGFDPREHALVAFGGAGGQHACGLARLLGMKRIVISPLAGLLSAYGIGAATITRHAVRPLGLRLDAGAAAALSAAFGEMIDELRADLLSDGVAPARIGAAARRLDLRYIGQASSLTVDEPPDGDWRREFEAVHRKLYGFAFEQRAIEAVAARVELGERGDEPATAAPPRASHPSVAREQSVYFDGGWRSTPVLARSSLPAGARVNGPAIVCEAGATTVIEPGWSALVTHEGDLLLAAVDHVERRVRGESADEADPVTLELFSSRFASIAEQMGDSLQRTALSTNVKERLDFSCAVFDEHGELVANAPHIPVHLGAMGETVRCLIDELRDADGGGTMRPGESYVTNDPYRGGSHLPDVTVVTPLFDDGSGRIRFFVASRAHHAEIGGITPGSMPAHSTRLGEEGVLIPPMRLAAGGRLDEAALRHLLAGGDYPSRLPEQNLADLAAQAAANQRGVDLLAALCAEHGQQTVAAYMRHIQDAAAAKTRAALATFPAGEHRFVDTLDDGTPIDVCVRIGDAGAEIDFSGSGGVHRGNLNATPAIVHSAVLYCLRCLIRDDVPLNAGMLRAVRIVIPDGLLNPPAGGEPAMRPAVVGGNVETSQRIVDCVLGALGVAAAGQGTMNNLALGDETFGYYETLGGGSGAGPGFDGADGVHVHMSNTRLTDVEVLEATLPLRLRRFEIRRGSGGAGQWRGGDGLVREIEFLRPMHVSLLTQRRTRAPYGLAGGRPGACGRNVLIRGGQREEELPGVVQVEVSAGDILRIETPGGGGYGAT